jgi:hypothetical protein
LFMLSLLDWWMAPNCRTVWTTESREDAGIWARRTSKR